MIRNQVALLLVVLALLILATGCAGRSLEIPSITRAVPSPTSVLPASLPNFDPHECWFPLPAGVKVNCGTVSVPEDRTESKLPVKTIQLAVAILHIAGSDPAASPLFFLEGGPGSSGIRFLFHEKTGWEALSSLAKDRDLVAIDQRGTGYSIPSLDCSPDEGFARCRRRLIGAGIDLSAYNSAENAADIDAIRLALGYSEINLIGGSYGTRLALTILRDSPGAVRSVVMDSVVPLQVHIDTSFNETFIPALNQLFSSCDKDPSCNRSYPDLEATFYTLMDRLNTDPVRVDMGDGEGTVGRAQFAGLLRQALYFTEALPYLPRLIHSTAAGDLDPLADMIQALPSNNGSDGMLLSVHCAEETLQVSEEEVKRVLEALPQSLQEYASIEINGLAELCKLWNVPRSPAFEEQPVASDVPVLLLAGQFDPVTRLSWAELAAQTLSHSYVFEIPGQGHGVIRTSACARSLVSQFLNDPGHEPDPSCLAEIGPPAFVVEP